MSNPESKPPRGPASGGPASGGPAPGAAGVGPLAQVLATRGGTAAPEAPFVIEHREALIYMLCEAAELEHGIMCQYLFAAFSLKRSAAEGLTETEAAAAARWRTTISHVAAQEMLHLALVQNLISAIGGAPHLARPNLPQPANHYPAGVQLALLPFGEQALRHFMFLERPEGMDLQDAEGIAAVGRAAPSMSEGDIVPHRQDFATVGHLYRSIEVGIAHLASKYGEDWLFLGSPRAQATGEYFGWPELVVVSDVASAQRAIDTILEQGEGPRGEWRSAHFGRFVDILDEYEELKAANPDFEPARPVMAANTRQSERDIDVPLITDELTAQVVDLFNVVYEVLLLALQRFLAHTEETDPQLKALADAAVGLMVRVLDPLGGVITTLPVGEGHPGKTAGPSFELFYESDYLLPHRVAAWAMLAERLDVAAKFCAELCGGPATHVAERLEPVRSAIRQITQTMAAHLPQETPHARLAAPQAGPATADVAAVMQRAAGLAAAVSGASQGGDTARALAGVFDDAYAAAAASASGQAPGGLESPSVTSRLVDSVLRPLADAMERLGGAGDVQAPDGRQVPEAGPAPDAGSAGSPGAAANGGEPLWEAAKAATSLWVRLRRAGTALPELAEAAAALQDLACQAVPAADRDRRLSAMWEIQAGLPPAITVARNGPYLLANVPSLVSHLGTATRPTPQLALCRCGGSSIKPLCDGSHASNGFTDAKDDKRVPDRLDTYPGQQVTILDNRGICQHSGYCTDRLPGVFRTRGEPFVAPSGGRMDEIIRAVRDCPSGALGYAFGGGGPGGTPAAMVMRDHADWGNTRPPSVEVTKDGPYRITGGITLTGADGKEVARNLGASREHYALCRCGHSQNKPFCSGMHWYVDFRDPAAAPGYEPTLFEWAGGLAPLRRMARFFYEKHVPADPLLAPLFAEMPADQPERLAQWFAEVFGGPPLYSRHRGSSQTAQAPADGEFTEPQRERWAALLVEAAGDAGLPADAQFRSAFVSCVEWASHTAFAQSGTGAPAAAEPVPRWDWGPGGPPVTTPRAGEPGEAAEPVPLPGPDQPVSFAAHIKPLFRERDRQSMSFVFDLWSEDDVRAHAADILARLSDGSMPCDGPWPSEQVGVFQRWTETGTPP